MNFLKKLFDKKAPAPVTPPKFTPEQYQQYDELKRQGLESLLGKLHDMVWHAIIPFQVGGALDLYCFPYAIEGTAMASMELIEPDGSGPKPSRIGTYELVAFTRHKMDDEADGSAFEQSKLRIWKNLTMVARYSLGAQLNPGDTAEIPADEGQPNTCLIFDEYSQPGKDFMIGDQKHGLLLVIEVFKGEMDFAMHNGSKALLDRLKKRGYYPYSDLDRDPVIPL